MSSTTLNPTELPADWPSMGDGEPCHIFPFRHRPALGDVALCGHVKSEPTRFPSNAAAKASGMPFCEPCREIAVHEGRRF